MIAEQRRQRSAEELEHAGLIQVVGILKQRIVIVHRGEVVPLDPLSLHDGGERRVELAFERQAAINPLR